MLAMTGLDSRLRGNDKGGEEHAYVDEDAGMAPGTQRGSARGERACLRKGGVGMAPKVRSGVTTGGYEIRPRIRSRESDVW